MSHDPAIRTGEHFLNGDEACAEGALACGCRFFAGYPITPATEIAETMSRRLPEVGGVYIQMEDELASMNAILGASSAGVKAMTSTSGPGFSLMMENIGLGIMMEIPCVVVNIQRGGPSTGLPTMVGQQDMMQARWGSHGDYEMIALCPWSPQEMFDFAIRAFNLSEKYRIPVLIMADEVVGHMTEKVVIPPKEEIIRLYRKKPQVPSNEYIMYETNGSLVPPMANAGDGYKVITTGLTHNEQGYPDMTAEAHEKLITRLCNKILLNKADIVEVEERELSDAEVVVVAYGSPARSAVLAIKKAREQGIKAGLLRLRTVWPFPEAEILKLAKQAKTIIVPEINKGQIVREIERCAKGNCEVILISKLALIHTPDEILEVIKNRRL
ncbi:2-oxoacid:acceptor oxidoreductase subunit alpha [Ancylomarina euxinus]|uniref:2-oxoacid:acceptor oxidoreductase subunit alpha n=1 Tax=Ancylomarina euxinus TaxID=2283627 RepID=A0A425XXX1_9BACT|nr:2-oxoacid:acceptor oxidoreductase subunit alpha [Ancylomarina euxinus]MCZ4696044.1 2-oxoacid:acceptor oxidoreductase subunit alpha [Ancylomarina euxinus]MUP13983.1 2-oxoacid:acceptor oxidoreductase subunit alpha [Ancylomarina euxinus]RRG19560.1 2-oxoacid:acceptor oxidoreductase subunit alpha [Ancylomarina euxinus]